MIPKIISVIPYPSNYSVSYPLSLKLFCQLSLIPKNPNRASDTHELKMALLAREVSRAIEEDVDNEIL